MLNHSIYLAHALEEAEKAFQAGNFPVGAILVDSEGLIIDRAYNTGYQQKGYALHAELNLILANQTFLFNNQYSTILYSTLEPCIMCLGAALMSRIECIVWAADDYWGGGTQCYNFNSNYLLHHPCQLISPPSKFLQKHSVSLVRAYLEQRDPQYLDLILGSQLL